MKKKVSIVIPVYNGEKFIKQTIINILKSSYQNLEIIIVNDGSTDNSLHICKNLQKKDSRINIYTKENGGIVSARNFGVSKVNGDYLCFCDQDDIVQSDTYRRMVSCMEQDKSDVCMCSTGRYIEGRVSVFEMSDNGIYIEDEILRCLLYPLIFNGYSLPVKMSSTSKYPHIWNCMFSMTFWKKYGFCFRAYVNFEDDLLLKVDMLCKAQKVSTIAYVGYYWRVNLKSESYAHRFVEDIAYKQQQCYRDMKTCLMQRVNDPMILNLFTNVVRCGQYLDAIHNLTSPLLHKNISFIREYYEKMIYTDDFSENIKIRRYVKKGRIKQMILLPLLARRWTLLSYEVEKILNKLLLLSLHSHILTVIERRLKNIYGGNLGIGRR